MHGFYEVGDSFLARGIKKFHYKIDALVYATKTHESVKWNFHDDVWSKFPTEIPISTSLKQLYKKRAQQLRDSYDYLILFYSGGSDSWTIFKTFIDNNLFVDEIYIRWPIKAIQGNKIVYHPNTEDTSAYNFLSEWDFVILKDIEWIRKVSPKTKITIYDWTEDISPITEKEFFVTNHHISLWNIKRFSTQGHLEKKMLDIGKRVAIIFGIDKPLIKKLHDGFYMHFSDNFVGLAFTDGFRESKVEYFYWTPDMPEIVVAQAQNVVYNILKKSNYSEIFNIFNNLHKSENFRYYNDLVKSICFRDYDLTKFQSDKPTNVLYSEKDSWAFKIPEYNRAIQNWSWHINQYFKLIDNRFLDVRENIIYGVRSINSKYYKIFSFND